MVAFYKMSVPVFVRAFTNLAANLKKGEAYAKANNMDPKTLLEARLYADMKPLTYQIQRCSDTAKLSAVRLAGVETVSMEDTETTFDQLYERIQKTVDFLEAIDEKAYEGKDTAEIKFKQGGVDVTYTGESYMTEFALANFFFHSVTAYDIMRHMGVPLGKIDYLRGGYM